MRRLPIALVLVSSVAVAEPRRVAVVRPPESFASIDVVPNVIFLNRCKGGCTIKKGTTNDARTHTSEIPGAGGMFTMSEWMWGDAEWNQLVQCMKEVYSPYGVTVTDVQPDPSVDYNEGIVAGTPAEIALPPEFGGIAPVMGNCNPVDHGLSFSFANIYTVAEERVHEICWTASQEIAHTYGLDHSYEIAGSKVSACNDPMTYRTDCGGQKFFRDEAATCGEYEPRDCRCAHTQNTHNWLTTVMGPGTPITTASIALTSPAPGTTTITDGAFIHATASAQRGVEKVQLFLNGYKWAEVPGVPFGSIGQPSSDYSITLPANVPDGVIDIKVVASDDLDVTAESTITVTKGAPCESAASCLEGQKCTDGRCAWDAPAGETGDSCDFPQFCKNEQCLKSPSGDEFCSADCRTAVASSCPAGLECIEVANGNGAGKCFPPVDAGCCSTQSSTPRWPVFALGAMVLGLLVRRRATGSTAGSRRSAR